MKPATSRVLEAVKDELAERDLTDCAGGVVEIRVKLDAAGCPRRITIKTEVEHEIERKRPCAVAV